jgi:hypothetical protein
VYKTLGFRWLNRAFCPALAFVIVSKKTLLILRQYFAQYQPKEWLFEGEGGGQYTDSSIYSILKRH